MRKAAKALQTIVLLYLLVSLLLSAFVSFGAARWQIIEHRAPFLLVDIAVSQVESTLADGTPEGTDHHGEYIVFFPDLFTGDHVLTVFVWNPFTNWCDDIITRHDFTL